MFRESALFRSKWDERHGSKTYGEMAIDKALSGMKNFYSPIVPAPANEDFDDEMNRLLALNPEDITKYPWTDIGAGMLFADFYENCLRYVPERKSWFYYETAFAREHEDEFVEMVTKSNAKAVEHEIRESKKEYEQSQTRVSKLDTIIQKLYEDSETN